MDFINQKIYKSLSDCINEDLKNTNILLMVSGGQDSMFMLHCFHKISNLFNKISVIHINYTSHKESNNMSFLVSNTCKQMGFQLFDKQVKLEKNNYEHNARLIRYNYANRILNQYKFDYIITGHHEEDQIETIYKNLSGNSNNLSLMGIRE